MFGNGSGGESIWGKKFKDDAGGLKLKHDRMGVVSMGNSGKNSNTSQVVASKLATHNPRQKAKQAAESETSGRKRRLERGHCPTEVARCMPRATLHAPAARCRTSHALRSTLSVPCACASSSSRWARRARRSAIGSTSCSGACAAVTASTCCG